MINLKVRIKNKVFWITFIPYLLVLAKEVAELFGYTLEIEGISNQLVGIVETVFMLLGVIGIVNDPTTAGVSDSERAMAYDSPN